MRMFMELLLAIPCQGSTFTYGDTVLLPTTSNDDADHGAVAINSAGDLLCVFSAERTDLAAGAFQVEACFLPYQGAGTWSAPNSSANAFLLGSAKARAFGLDYEACRKPDVIAVGSDFFVVWPRSSGDRTQHRLEMARLRPNGAGSLTVDAPAAGVGYVVDPQIDGNEAGIMPDLAEIPGSNTAIAVVYVDDELQAPPLREFDLRFLRADFATLPPAGDGPYVLVDDLPFDDSPFGGSPIGGEVLPDVVRDDFGNRVLAYENFQQAGHGGAGITDGRARLAWFADPGSGPPTLLASHLIQAGSKSEPVRRPNLAASRMDAANTVTVACVTASTQQPAPDILYYEAAWNGTAIALTDLGYPSSATRADSMAIPAHGASLRACLGIRGGGGHARLVAFLETPPSGLRLIPSQSMPWRPSLDLLEPAPAGAGANLVLPITYEAPVAGGDIRVFLRVDRG